MELVKENQQGDEDGQGRQKENGEESNKNETWICPGDVVIWNSRDHGSTHQSMMEENKC